MIQTTHRPAIAMIELIFAIVIMGIILMSAPMLISTASKSGYAALQQEAIVALSSEVGIILTHHWDEGNTDKNITAPILRTGGDTALNESTDTDGNLARVRWGTSPHSTRSFLTSSGGGRIDASATLGNDGGDRDDIDDFIATDKTGLFDEETTTIEEGDYIDRAGIQLTTEVSYINDSPDGGSYSGSSLTLDFSTTPITANTTNIKMVDVVLSTTSTDTSMEKEISLRAFSCNIGTFELEERTY